MYQAFCSCDLFFPACTDGRRAYAVFGRTFAAALVYVRCAAVVGRAPNRFGLKCSFELCLCTCRTHTRPAGV